MKNYYILISAFLVVSSAIVTLSTAVRTRSARALYGEFCDNRAIRCDTSLSLTCKNQTCVCMKPENMIYDPSCGACASLAREKCRFTVLEEYRSWQEEILCVSNAHCDFAESICVCDKDYIELANGTCIPKKNNGEPCITSADCRQDIALICQDSTCICNSATSEYSEELTQCVGLANEPCVNDLCTANAICREEPRRLYGGGGASSVEVEDSSDEEYGEVVRDPASIGRCQCRTAFGVTSDGKCKLGYSGRCDHQHAKCMSWLKCKEGTCVCRYPTHQVYDRVTETCLSQVGGPCTKPDEDDGKTNNSSKIGCTGSAVCAKVSDTTRYQCSCPRGFIENADRGCDLDYGQACRTQHLNPYSTRQQSSSGSSPPPSAKCDRIGKLFCIDGRCQCEDDLHIYDEISRSCKGLVGATCVVKSKGDCVSGAYCVGRRGSRDAEAGSSRNPDGLCACQMNHKEGDGSTCVPRISVPPQEHSNTNVQESSLITLKSGGTLGGRNDDEIFNSTVNSIWTIFEDLDDD